MSLPSSLDFEDILWGACRSDLCDRRADPCALGGEAGKGRKPVNQWPFSSLSITSSTSPWSQTASQPAKNSEDIRPRARVVGLNKLGRLEALFVRASSSAAYIPTKF